MFAYKKKIIKKENITILNNLASLNFIYTSEKEDFKLISNHMKLNFDDKVYSLSLGDFISKRNFPFSSKIFQDLGLTKTILKGFEVHDQEENKKISDYAKIFLNNLLRTDESIEYNFDFAIRFQNKENNLSHEYKILLFFKLLNKLLSDSGFKENIILLISDFELFQNHYLSKEIKAELLSLKKFGFLKILINIKSTSTLFISEADYWNFYKSFRNKNNDIVVQSFKTKLEKINVNKNFYKKEIFFLLKLYQINFIDAKKIILVTDKRTKYLIDSKFSNSIETYLVNETEEISKLIKYLIALDFAYKVRVVLTNKDVKTSIFQEELAVLMKENKIEYTKFNTISNIKKFIDISIDNNKKSFETEKVKNLYSFIESTIPNYFLSEEKKIEKPKKRSVKKDFFDSLDEFSFEEVIEESLEEAINEIVEETREEGEKNFDEVFSSQEEIHVEATKTPSKEIEEPLETTKEQNLSSKLKNKIIAKKVDQKKIIKKKVDSIMKNIKLPQKIKAVVQTKNIFKHEKKENNLSNSALNFCEISFEFDNVDWEVNSLESIPESLNEKIALTNDAINFVEVNFSPTVATDLKEEKIVINNPSKKGPLEVLKEETLEILKQELLDNSVKNESNNIFDIEEIINNQINTLTLTQAIEIQNLARLKLLDNILSSRISVFLQNNVDRNITKQEMETEIFQILTSITNEKKKNSKKGKSLKNKQKKRSWKK